MKPHKIFSLYKQKSFVPKKSVGILVFETLKCKIFIFWIVTRASASDFTVFEKRTLNHPVNLLPLFLFRKHGSVCDPEKKLGPKYGVQNTGCKQRYCYSKREEAAWPLLFLNSIDPVFLHPAFCAPYFGQIFVKFQILKKYQVNLIN